jgi:hypothetical protein
MKSSPGVMPISHKSPCIKSCKEKLLCILGIIIIDVLRNEATYACSQFSNQLALLDLWFFLTGL